MLFTGLTDTIHNLKEERDDFFPVTDTKAQPQWDMAVATLKLEQLSPLIQSHFYCVGHRNL